MCWFLCINYDWNFMKTIIGLNLIQKLIFRLKLTSDFIHNLILNPTINLSYISLSFPQLVLKTHFSYHRRPFLHFAANFFQKSKNFTFPFTKFLSHKYTNLNTNDDNKTICLLLDCFMPCYLSFHIHPLHVYEYVYIHKAETQQ